MPTLTERPHTINFSKNDIRYVFQLTDLTRAGLYLQVKLLYASVGSAPHIVIDTFDLKPDSNGEVYLYIQAYLDSVLDYAVPDRTAQFTNANAQACSFFIHYCEIEDASPNPDWIETEETDYNPRIVIKGGIEKHKNARNNFFINYFATQKPFLTWQPSGRFVYPDEKIYLSFLNENISTAGYTIRVTAKNTAGASSTYSITTGELNSFILHMKADPVTLNIAGHLSGQLYYYEVSVYNASNVRIVNNYRFYIEYRPAYYYYDLIYQNSISGFDFVRVRGDVEESFDRQFDEIDGGFNLNDWTNQVKLHETKYSGLVVRRKYKADVGYQRSKNEQSALIELLLSTEIYHLINNRWVPLLTLQKDQDLGFNSDIKKSFPIEWCLSESNEVYTPIELSFGEGAIVTEDTPPPPDECDAISFVDTPTLPDAQVGVAYSYSFTITGSTPIDLTINSRPSWMNINLVGNEVQYTGTPTTAATNITVSITLDNCNGPIGFEDTIDITTEPDPGITTYGCGSSFGESNFDELSYHNYGYYYLDTTGATLMSINWTANARPNRFTIYNETDGSLVDTTGWVGDASYMGPWGSSLHTALYGTMTFAPAAGATYKVKVEAGGSPGLNDSWTISITCA